MSDSTTTTEAAVEVRGRKPQVAFERKLYLSILIGNDRYYVAKLAQGQYYTLLTRNRADAQLLALYQITDEAAGTFVLQTVPNDESTASTGSFLTFTPTQGYCYGLSVHMAEAARLTVMQNGNELRMKFAGNFLVAARAPDGNVTFWIPGPSIFENAVWLAETTVRRSGNMAGADLRNVEQLRNIAGGLVSVANADLRRADFSGATLNACDFRGARFGNTHFYGANLYVCQLDGVTATTTDLTGATFSQCELNLATLTGATFSNTAFPSSRLDGAKLQNCNLSGCRFHDARLNATDFTGATLTKAEFLRADAQNVIMTRASAQRADFSDAKLNNARLDKATLAGAKFNKATMTRANLSEATFGEYESQRTDFSQARLYEIDFTACNLGTARLDEPAQFQENASVTPDNRRRALLVRATVPLAVISATSWRMLDLTGATISAQPASFKRFNGDYCNFPDNFELQNFDLSFATFRHARLYGARLQHTEADGSEANSGPDFSNADLRTAQFLGADLYQAKFREAQLNGAKLANASFESGDFSGARLESVALGGSEVITDLSSARLLNVKFDNANIGRGTTRGLGANFSRTMFYGDSASISNATLDGAQFSGAYLTGLDFTGGNQKAMEAMNFAGACLANCTFKKAALNNAVLSDACLLGADFTDAQLPGTSMSGANVWFQELKDVDITRPDGSKTKIDTRATIIAEKATNSATTCPSGASGPCQDAAWRRSGSPVKQWPT